MNNSIPTTVLGKAGFRRQFRREAQEVSKVPKRFHQE